ncbi:MAG: PQQ-dependent sugar dehydrogenase, partial [Myxococcota bacterium]
MASTRVLLVITLLVVGLPLLDPWGSEAHAATTQAGFIEETVLSGLTQPTAVRFSSDGRVFVAEKSGLIKVFASLTATTPTVFADLRTNVHNFWDRGLLGLELHPNFPATPYVYALYTFDAPIGGTAPRWGTAGGTSDPCPSPPGPTSDGCVVAGRLSRLTAAGNVMTGSEQVLVEDWCQQYPSHSMGSIAFGADGMLYASGGEGSSFTFTDYGQDGNPVNPCGDPGGAAPVPPSAEGGSLRSQDIRTSGDPLGFNGSVIRIDPITGEGLASNPLGASPDTNT